MWIFLNLETKAKLDGCKEVRAIVVALGTHVSRNDWYLSTYLLPVGCLRKRRRPQDITKVCTPSYVLPRLCRYLCMSTQAPTVGIWACIASLCTTYVCVDITILPLCTKQQAQGICIHTCKWLIMVHYMHIIQQVGTRNLPACQPIYLQSKYVHTLRQT